MGQVHRRQTPQIHSRVDGSRESALRCLEFSRLPQRIWQQVAQLPTKSLRALANWIDCVMAYLVEASQDYLRRARQREQDRIAERIAREAHAAHRQAGTAAQASAQSTGRRREEIDSSSEDVEVQLHRELHLPTRAERIKRLKAAGVRWQATWKRFAFWILAFQVDVVLTEAYCCLTSWLRRGQASLLPDHRQWRVSRQRQVLAEKLQVESDYTGRNEPPYRRHLPTLARLRGKMNVWRYTEH